MQFYLDDIPIQLTRKAVKNLNLRIQHGARVQLSVPKACSPREINDFLEAKKSWIKKHYQPVLAKTSQFNTGDVLYVSGKPYTLQIMPHAKRPQVTLKDDQLYCYVKEPSEIQAKQKALETWYKDQMQSIMPPLIEKWTAQIGVEVLQWRLRWMKTRWGTCNPRAKRIWLNASLMQMPIACIELVLVHELVHLLETGHNKRFYTLMTQHLPDWPAREKLLKSYKTKL